LQNAVIEGQPADVAVDIGQPVLGLYKFFDGPQVDFLHGFGLMVLLGFDKNRRSV
jgi:hypothetical protein